MPLPSVEYFDLYSEAHFGDTRLNERAAKICYEIEQSIEKGVSAISHNPASYIATTRFMNNPSVSPDAILDPVMDRAVQQVQLSHVLIIQDTTEMSFPGLAKTNLGKTGNGNIQGFFIHPCILVNPNTDAVLGLGSVDMWTRTEHKGGVGSTAYKKLPFEEKESWRWFNTPLQVVNQLDESVRSTIIGDCEMDNIEIYCRHTSGDFGPKADLLVRACYDRKLDGEPKKLFETVSNWHVQGEKTITIKQRKGRKKWKATLAVRYGKVKLAVPAGNPYRKAMKAVELFVVDAREINPPANGDEPVHWRLFTTHSVTSFAEALSIIDWYSKRWIIEEIFRIYKSGIQAETANFRDGEGLMNWCAMKLPIAIRLMDLLNKRDDETPDSGAVYLTEAELSYLENQEDLLISPASTIYRPLRRSIAWCILLISIIGGYKAVPSAKPPGQTVMWRGLDRLTTAGIAWEAALRSRGKE